MNSFYTYFIVVKCCLCIQAKVKDDLLFGKTTFLGTGYDLKIGNPDGTSIYNSGIDPGLKASKHVLHMSTFKSGNSYCPGEATCVSVYDTNYVAHLIDDLAKYWQQTGKYWKLEGHAHHHNKSIFPGRGSRAGKELQKVLEEDRDAMVRMEKETLLAEAVYNYHNSDTRLNSEFEDHLCNLPKEYNSRTRPEYLNFLDTWGTHVIVGVRLGQKEIQRQLFKEEAYVHQMFAIPDYVQEIGIQIETINDTIYRSVTSNNTSPFSKSFTEIDSDNKPYITYETRVGARMPMPLSMNLQNISYFVSPIYVSTSEGPCSELNNKTLQSLQETVEAAVKYYMSEGVEEKVDIGVRSILGVPVFFPSGSYSLPSARTRQGAGCPDHGTWATGSRKHQLDVKDRGESDTRWSPGLYEAMRENIGFNFSLGFCTKTNDEPPAVSAVWEMGLYCVFKKGDCPRQFHISHIHVNDEDTHNRNEILGTLPDGLYNLDTRYDLCCRNDGDVSVPIVLPTMRPFFLVPVGNQCQSVYGMDSKLQWVILDTEDGISRIEGSVRPFGHVDTNLNLVLYFCYYTPNQELRSAGG